MLILDVDEKCLHHLTDLKETVMLMTMFVYTFTKQASFSKGNLNAVCYARM
jgi:hypothetical protein